MAEQFSHLLNPVKIKKLVHSWILEDSAHFDFGGFVVGEQQEQAHLLGKSHGILAGSPFVDAVFQELNCSVNWLMSEGSQIEPICTVAVVSGPVRHLLLGERIALNCLARTSGIATYCKKLADIAAAAGWKGRVAGTRKTTPGFRLPEKYAMIVGGIDTHRYDLSSMIMLKDNHITSLGSIQKAVNAARQVGGFSQKIEVECRSISDALEAAESGADIVMLDNFEPRSLLSAAEQIKQRHPNITIEASGGVTEHTLPEYFSSNVDVISLSRVSQGYDIVDFSLKVKKS